MDISTDITVLDNMMAREGLTGGDAVHQAAQETRWPTPSRSWISAMPGTRRHSRPRRRTAWTPGTASRWSYENNVYNFVRI